MDDNEPKRRKTDFLSQDKYAQKMERLGFKRRCYWIHVEDLKTAKRLLAQLRLPRINSNK